MSHVSPPAQLGMLQPAAPSLWPIPQQRCQLPPERQHGLPACERGLGDAQAVWPAQLPSTLDGPWWRLLRNNNVCAKRKQVDHGFDWLCP